MSNGMDGLRSERDRALRTRGAAAARLARARTALKEAERRGVPEEERRELRERQAAALEALRTARAAERRALSGITERVAALPSPVDRIAELSSRYPMALFPVRLETRFRRGPIAGDEGAAGELLVRIYPDGLLAQTHEPLLTEVEAEAGRAFWRRVFEGTPEPESWTALLAEADATRGAWIVEATTPENVDVLPGGNEADAAPAFPAIEARPAGWHRAPEAPTLPDRWIVSAYRDGVRRARVFSGPVREGLALALRLSADGEEPELDDAVDLTGDGLEIEPELRWVYDFEEAERAGMAVRIPVDDEDLRLGFGTVLVAGVRTSEDAESQAGELERLFEGHRLSRGWELVPQGQKTNNSQDAPSDYPPDDPAGARSYAIFRGEPRAAPGTDGHRLAAAMGIDRAALDHVAGAERDEQTPARAMADALWPATLGYFFEQMMAPQVDRATARRLRAWTRDHVRARGPLPAFRVGAVPYGVLPAGSLFRWRPHPADAKDPVVRGLPERLQRLARLWSRFTHTPPRVGRSADPDADLVEALAQDASAQVAQVRRTLGQDTTWNLLGFLGIDFDYWQAVQRLVARDILQAMGAREGDPRILYMSFAEAAHDFAGPLVQVPPLSETEPLAFDYIAWLRTASIDALRDQLAPPTDEPLGALLYLMLRHALLEEYDGSALDLLGWRELATAVERLEPEIVGIIPVAASDAAAPPVRRRTGAAAAAPVDAVLTDDGVPTRRTAWDRFDARVPGVTGDRTVGSLLVDPRAADEVRAPFVRELLAGLDGYRANLRALEGLPTAELERLFTETLDSCSHRIDPWITSLYSRRLEQMRAAAPRGSWTGCYGWVHDLKADPEPERVPVVVGGEGRGEPRPEDRPENRPGDGLEGRPENRPGDGLEGRPEGRGVVIEMARTDSGGYVYAPSMLHGATAAVLRSAYLTRSGAGDAGETYAVDLSSRRARLGLELVDAVRGEQPLGAALGYRFERGLHEGHPGVELDRFIDAFRSLYPLVANKAEDTGEPAESVAARNVVDGLRLREAWRQGTIPWGSGELPSGGAERTAIEAELTALDDAVDAVSDLLLAESVHQVLRGSTAGAGATLDSLAKGHRPPEPEVVGTPRGGGVLHQRVALVVSEATLPAEWAALGPTPRAAASPELNAWLAGLLGRPDEVACMAGPEGAMPRPVTLVDLGIQPVDLLAYAAAADAGAPSAELDRRVAWEAVGAGGPDAVVAIDYEDGGGARLSVAEALETLAAVARAIGFARPLAPADLIAPERESALGEADPMTPELDGRAAAADTALQGAIDALETAASDVRSAPAGTDPDLSALRGALAGAATLGVHGAFPGTRHDDSAAARTALLALADSVAVELAGRAEASASAADGTERIRAVFGRGFPVLPRFVPGGKDLLGPALASEPDLGAEGDAEVERWLAGVARVREPLDAWRQVVVYARALADDAAAGLPRPRIAQLPLEADDGLPRWAALDHGAGPPHRSGLVSLALFGDTPPPDAPWSGLLLDAWPEILPNREEEAGVVFHFDAPGAQAPHCVLLAVPSDPTAERWSWEDLEATLLHTLELARIRALDLSNLGLFGQVLPMTYLAANAANAAVATSLVGLLMAEPLILTVES